MRPGELPLEEQHCGKCQQSWPVSSWYSCFSCLSKDSSSSKRHFFLFKYSLGNPIYTHYNSHPFTLWYPLHFLLTSLFFPQWQRHPKKMMLPTCPPTWSNCLQSSAKGLCLTILQFIQGEQASESEPSERQCDVSNGKFHKFQILLRGTDLS